MLTNPAFKNKNATDADILRVSLKQMSFGKRGGPIIKNSTAKYYLTKQTSEADFRGSLKAGDDDDDNISEAVDFLDDDDVIIVDFVTPYIQSSNEFGSG